MMNAWVIRRRGRSVDAVARLTAMADDHVILAETDDRSVVEFGLRELEKMAGH